MKISVNDDINHEPEDFNGCQSFCLIAEDSDDMEQLRRLVLLREHTSLRAVHFSFETAPRKPMDRVYTEVDVALVEDSIFEPREVDNQAKKGD